MNARYENVVLEVPDEVQPDVALEMKNPKVAPDTAPAAETPRPPMRADGLQLVLPEMALPPARPVAGSRRPLFVACALVVVAAIAIAAFVMRGSHSGAPAIPAKGLTQDRATLTVALAAPMLVHWPETMQAAGGINAWQEASVGAEVTGLRLAQVYVDIGDQVRRGQLLARFDDATMVAAVNQQKAVVAEMAANAAEADANAVRAGRLRQTGALSEQSIVQYETRARAVRAEVESAQARLHSQQLALGYTRVLAPDDGVISSRSAMLGSVAAPGSELFRLVRQNRIEWRAEVPAAQLSRVQIGQPAKVQLQDGTTVAGRVRQIAPMLNENTRVGIAYVELERAQLGGARPGMYASGSIALGTRPALTLPASAIVLRDGHEYVFTLDAGKHAMQTKVTLGRRAGNDVEILSGISEGTQVITSGAPFLNDGDLVRVGQAATAQTPSAVALPAAMPAGMQAASPVALPKSETAAR